MEEEEESEHREAGDLGVEAERESKYPGERDLYRGPPPPPKLKRPRSPGDSDDDDEARLAAKRARVARAKEDEEAEPEDQEDEDRVAGPRKRRTEGVGLRGRARGSAQGLGFSLAFPPAADGMDVKHATATAAQDPQLLLSDAARQQAMEEDTRTKGSQLRIGIPEPPPQDEDEEPGPNRVLYERYLEASGQAYVAAMGEDAVDSDDIARGIADLCQDWCPAEHSGLSFVDHASDLFARALSKSTGADADRAVRNTDDVQLAYSLLLKTMVGLWSLVQRSGLEAVPCPIKEAPNFGWTNEYTFKKLFGQLHHGRMALLHAHAGEESRSPDSAPVGRGEILGFDLQPLGSVSKLPQDIKVFMYCLKRAQINNFRRCKGAIYKEVMTPDGHKTHAWEHYMTMEQFVDWCCQKEVAFEMWLGMCKHKKQVVDWLRSNQEAELHDLEDDRTVTAWLNGIFDATTLKFYDYATSPLPDSVVATKYFPVPFDTARYENDLYDIEHPIRKVLGDQGFTKLEQIWILGMCVGRMIFELGTHDEWELAAAIIGWAGTGKGTLGEMAKHLFSDTDVAPMSNNHEKTFGLSGLLKKIVIAFDLKESMLSVGDLQTMISKEPTSVPVKHGPPIQVRWLAPLMLLMNEFPASWKSSCGALERRLLVVQMDEPVVDRDTTLKAKCREQYGSFYRLAAMCYRYLAQQYGKLDAWKFMPEKLRNGTKQVQEIGNTFNQFINDKDDVVREKGAYVYAEDLRQRYKAYCSKRSMKAQPLGNRQLEINMKGLGIKGVRHPTEHRRYPPTASPPNPAGVRADDLDDDTEMVRDGVFYYGLRLKPEQDRAYGQLSFGPPAPGQGSSAPNNQGNLVVPGSRKKQASGNYPKSNIAGLMAAF